MGSKKITAEYMALLNERPYLTPVEASIFVRSSKNTIYNAIYSGALKHSQIGNRYRIKREALDKWVERGAPR